MTEMPMIYITDCDEAAYMSTASHYAATQVNCVTGIRVRVNLYECLDVFG